MSKCGMTSFDIKKTLDNTEVATFMYILPDFISYFEQQNEDMSETFTNILLGVIRKRTWGQTAIVNDPLNRLENYLDTQNPQNMKHKITPKANLLRTIQDHELENFVNKISGNKPYDLDNNKIIELCQNT